MGTNQLSLPILNTASQPAIDPLCGMKVNVPTAKHTFNDGGKAYDFCGRSCLVSWTVENRVALVRHV